jgi:hypothetical protein
MDEDAVDGMVGGYDPAHLATQRLRILQREQQVVRAKPQPDPAHRAGLGKALEDDPNGIDHGLIGMKHDLAIGLAPHQASRQATAQFTTGGLVADTAVQTGTQDVEFGFRHGAFETENEAVVKIAWMIQAVGIGDQRSRQGAEVEQTIPISIVTCQPRNLETQDDADPAHGDLGGHMSKAGTSGGLGTGEPEVIIDHRDGGLRPAQPQSLINQGVLAARRLGVGLHLRQGGLANVDEGGPAQMLGADGGVISHAGSPVLDVLLQPS